MLPQQTIQEAKDFLSANYKKGVECPCCKQHVRLYKRKFNSVMARTLIRLYVLTRDKKVVFHHVKDIVQGISSTGTNDFSKLVYWGLIQEKVKDPDDKIHRTSGYWRITDKGREFIEHKFLLPKYVFVYNSECRGISGEETDIKQALTEKFNYDELIGKNESKNDQL